MCGIEVVVLKGLGSFYEVRVSSIQSECLLKIVDASSIHPWFPLILCKHGKTQLHMC